MMSDSRNERDQVRSDLSVLMDGEAQAGEFARALAAWRQDGESRAEWHQYALIGDVLRSEDLARPAGRDCRFLADLRERLAAEPVVLAPQAPARDLAPVRTGRWAALRAHRTWTATAAMTAGCVMAVGAALVWREAPTPAGVAPGLQLARMDAAPVSSPASVPDLSTAVVQRNPDLDRYLMAHRQFTQGPALAAPGGVRQVALTPNGQ